MIRIGDCFKLHLIAILLVFGLNLVAQDFSEDPATFAGQVVQILKSTDSDAYRKIAYDFEQSWNQKLTSSHRDTIMYLTQEMRRKGYPTYPHLKHFYAYVSLAVAEKGVQADQLSKILTINVDALHTLSRSEYANFLFEMNTFFARGYLHRTKNKFVLSEGGDFNFQLLGPVFKPEAEEVEVVPHGMSDEEILAQELASMQPAAAEPVEIDPFADPFATDPFSNTGFGGQQTAPAEDPFASDPFAQTSSGFGSDPFAQDPFDNSAIDPFAPPAAPTTAPDDPLAVSSIGSVAYVEDFVAIMQGQYPIPEKTGPIISLDATRLFLVTPYDSLQIENVSGAQLMKDKVFVGKKGTLIWPQENSRTKEAIVSLGEFFFKSDRSSFWSPNAELSLAPYTTDPVKGLLRYQSETRYKNQLSNHPIFTSYYPDLQFDLAQGQASYEGGLELRGNKVFGNSVSKGINVLSVMDEAGRKAVIRSRYFTLGDSLITTENGTFTFFHGNDSIYHPGVKLYYYPFEQRLVVTTNKKYDVTSFHSTYHRMQINAEVFKWQIDKDSIDFDIASAKALLPVTFSSDDYYNDIKYKRMSGGFGFHPISIAVYFAQKYGVTDFNYADLVLEYKLNERLVYGAMVMLEQYNFIVFNEKSGHVSVLDKAYLFYAASARKRDFDNLFVPSKLEGIPNASMHLDSLDLKVRGVDRFYMTTDFKISVKPEGGKLSIGENRNITFDGEIETGGFDYKGKDFEFDYDAFLINMANIDSIRLQITVPDSMATELGEKKSLQNHLTETSGSLYLNLPGNKSNKEENDTYPYFVSESEAIVYFDGEEVLNGAYDKSVKFIVPPLEVDDINSEDGSSLQFPGVFNSGGIFPMFEDTLRLMPDNSLGFIHEIPEEGYQLYGTPAKTYETINLSSEGMRGKGKIDFLNASLFSEDFIYYPDSVTADGYYGIIEPGQVNKASFPQAELGAFEMYWLPKKDSMFLRTTEDPFSFYNGTAKLTGAANITQNGVYGYGSLLTRGSIAKSQNLSFREFAYSATHANFTVLSDDPNKPAMAGDDISLRFDLTNNTADITPEQIGVAALSFPYAQINTSITNAKWFLDDSLIVMSRPPDVALEDTYFYSTRVDLDSLAFNGDTAIYDIRKYELNVRGIPYILSADAQIIPEGNQTTILANSNLETFSNAEIVLSYPNATHYLNQGVIDIYSRNSYSGTAVYLLPVLEDTFEIKMSSFYLEELFQPDGSIDSTTVATGLVSKSSQMEIAPGFLYKGVVTLRAYKQALELSGFVKPEFESLPNHDNWISYDRVEDSTSVTVNIANSTFEDGEAIVAGLHYGTSGKLYHTILEKRFTPADEDFFLAKGILSYNAETRNFKVEEPGKGGGISYEGSTFIYSDTSQTVVFEGNANFISQENNLIKLQAAVLGYGERSTNVYEMDALITFDLGLDKTTIDPMAEDMIDIVERLGSAPANDLSLEAMLKIANVAGDLATKKYEKNSFKDYIPLNEISPDLERDVVISGVKMVWNDERNAWHNTTKLGVSNLLDNDINAKLDGFIEFGRDDTGGEVVNLFIEAAPGSWYYFNYQQNSLLVYSSNTAFNNQIKAKSNYGNSKPGELVLIFGDENETLKFLNEFRKVYFGVDDPYNLVYPNEGTLNDENFDTIEEDEEDDGFGF